MYETHSLDFIHGKLEKYIRLVQSYAEIKELSFIIKSCRIKPIQYVEKRSSYVSFYRTWFDEFGNSLNLINKKINITYNDLSIDRNMIVSTDMYYGLSFDKIFKISKLAFIFAGKDEDLNSDCAMICFLGIDNFLRCYMYLYNEWTQISPLYLGMKNLKIIANNSDIKYFKELKNKENCVIPCISWNAWITCLPANEKLLTILDRQSNIVLPVLTYKENK